MWTLSAMIWVWGWGLVALGDWMWLDPRALVWSRHRYFRQLMPAFWGSVALLGNSQWGPVFFRGGLTVLWMLLLIMTGLFESRISGSSLGQS